MDQETVSPKNGEEHLFLLSLTSWPQVILLSAFILLSDNLKDRFCDITYKDFGCAIKRCAWWVKENPGLSKTFEALTMLSTLLF